MVKIPGQALQQRCTDKKISIWKDVSYLTSSRNFRLKQWGTTTNQLEWPKSELTSENAGEDMEPQEL
jgi:hypothetical protein